MGERAVRYRARRRSDLVDVCPLCQETAAEYGWLKEGSPDDAAVDGRAAAQRARRLGALFDSRRRRPTPVANEPILRRLSEPELAMVEAADLFNASAVPAHGRRHREEPRRAEGVDRAALRRRTRELVITVAWDISWYQYRVTPDSAQPVRLPSAATSSHELEERFTGVERARRRRRPPRPGHRAPSEPFGPAGADRPSLQSETMIYCVIPRELEDELYDKMVEYYKDNPNVTVIVDRREGADRRERQGVRRQARDPRPPPGARPGNLPEHGRAREHVGKIAAVATAATKTFKNFIGGEWVDAAIGETFESTSPATGEALGVFPRSGAEDVDRAVAAAKAAFEELAARARRRSAARSSSASRSSSTEHKDELAELMTPRDGQGAARGRRRRPGSDRHELLHGRRGPAPVRPDDAVRAAATSST